MFKIKLKFIILFVIFALAAYNEGGPLYYRILYCFGAVLLLSILVLLVNKKSLNIDIQFDRSVYSTGDSGRFSVFLNNRGIIPISYLVVLNSGLKKLSSRYNGDAIYVGALNSKSLKYEIKFKNRGVYNFGDIEVAFRDTASIIESKSIYMTKALVHVYPRVINLDSGLFKGISLFNNYKLNSNGIEDVYTIRDNRKYRAGDNLKKINWKISAKLNDLYVRNHEVLVGEEFNVFLDMNKINYQFDATGTSEEQLVDSCVSMLHYLTKKNIVSKLFINGLNHRSFKAADRKDFEVIMDYFLHNKSDGTMPFVNFLKIYLNSDVTMNNLALITSRVDNDLMEFVMQLENRKKNLFIFFNQVLNEDGVNIVKLRKLGVKVIDASHVIR